MRWKISFFPLFFALSLQFAIPAAHASDETKKGCEHRLLEGKLTLKERLKPIGKFMGYLVPIIPTIKTAKDQNKRFFIFVEQPLIGVPTSIASTFVSSSLKWFSKQIISYFSKGQWLESNIWDSWLQGKTWMDTVIAYFSFNVASVFRNGATLDSSLSAKQKLWLNWWYSTLSYGVMTGGAAFAGADTPEKKIFAFSTVLYAGLWPIFSQYVGTSYITPYLFERFPNASLLNQLKDPNTDRVQLISEVDAEIAALKDKTDKESKKKLKIAESKRSWLDFFWKDSEQGQSLPKTKMSHYWWLKTKTTGTVTIIMVSIYFLMRWALVGDSADSGTLLPMVIEYLQGLAGRGPSQIKDLKLNKERMKQDAEFFEAMASAIEKIEKLSPEERSRTPIVLDAKWVEYGEALENDLVDFLDRFDSLSHKAVPSH